eukprot:scaffold20942_cov113-Isochrysis_galbana.AAC.4
MPVHSHPYHLCYVRCHRVTVSQWGVKTAIFKSTSWLYSGVGIQGLLGPPPGTPGVCRSKGQPT